MRSRARKARQLLLRALSYNSPGQPAPPAAVYCYTAPATFQLRYAAAMGLLYGVLVAAGRSWLLERQISASACFFQCNVSLFKECSCFPVG